MDKWRKYLSILNSPISLGTLFTLIISVLIFIYYIDIENSVIPPKSPLVLQIQKLSNQSIDFRLLMRGERKGSPDIMLLTVDEESILKLGRWPWSRSKINTAIEKAMNFGVKVMAFDIIFSEPQNDNLNAVDKIVSELKLNNSVPHQTLPFIDNIRASFNYDAIMANTIKKYADRLVLGSYYDANDISNAFFNDTCIQTLSETQVAYQYWENDQLPLGALDKTEISLPVGWKKLLQKQFIKIEKSSLAELNANKFFISPIKLLQAQFPQADTKELLALLYFSLKTDTEGFKTLWQKIKGISSPESLEQGETFMLSLIKLTDSMEKIEWENKSIENANNYCFTFLNKSDSLLATVEKNWNEIKGNKEPFSKLSFPEALSYLRSSLLYNPVKRVDKWWVNIPVLAEATKYSAYFNTNLDKDGVIRRTDLIARRGNQYVPSLALKSYLVASGYSAMLKFEQNQKYNQTKTLTSLEIDNDEGVKVEELPVDIKGQMLINYAGAQQMFPHVSVSELFSDNPNLKVSERVYDEQKKRWEAKTKQVNKADFLKNKLAIFGVTAQGVYDVRVTPFEENYPGAETHANVLDNLMRKDFLHKSDKEEFIMPLFILALGFVLTYLLTQAGAIVGLAVTLFCLLSTFIVDKYFFFNRGIVVNILFPILFTLALYTIMTFYKYFTEEKKKRELKGTFAKYVSPAIVDELLKHPDNIELGGKKQFMSVFFSDVRGFTTISEKLDPRALSDLLNSYLTPMTALVFKHQGTLDKYMGDAIMAFFGAPLADPKHAARACSCALEQLQTLKVLQTKLKSEGLPSIDIGIGINTGEMSVGNMGSATVRSYTVMGDAVNLGSRLEGINKEYGTRIIISEFTQNEIDKDQFFTREIDWVKVKGKNKPVRIFELMGEFQLEESQLRLSEYFKQGFSFYHEKKWQQAIDCFEKGLSYQPDDAPTLLYINRCKNYIAEPPPEDWDGVFTMKTK